MRNVDFAIISIDEKEFEAVLERVGKDTSWRTLHGEQTGRIYNQCALPGQSQRTVVAVRCLEPGAGEAQEVARDVVEDLDPGCILVVGTASGVPDEELSVGDVAVSSRIHDVSIEAVLADGRREYAVTGGPIHNAVARVAANLPAMKDALGTWYEIGLDRPILPGSENRPPAASAVAVASSNRRVENTELVGMWNQFARQVRAIEMESAGVYRATQGNVPFLAIRGIEAIIGDKGSPQWTHYARHAAAAFARALIQAWPSFAPGKPAGPELPEEHLIAYVEWLRAHHGWVEMIGLGAGELRMPLDEIYVPLRLGASPRHLAREQSPARLGKDPATDELMADRSMAGQREVKLEEAFVVAGSDRNVFIVGQPGAGKTTALKKLLWSIVKPASRSEARPETRAADMLDGNAIGLPQATIPIFLRLRTLTGPLLRRRCMAEYLQAELDSTARIALNAEIRANLGETLWQRGNLLLLLDGLDEVADAKLRGNICTYLEDELSEARKRGIRAVVSSRFSGMSSEIDLDRRRFARLEVHPLNDAQIEQLVTCWFRAAEQSLDKQGDLDRARELGERKGKSLATRLQKAEYKARRIRELSTNPMLLTLLCVVVMKKYDIPRRRVDFFRECLDILLTQWTRHRSPAGVEQSIRPDSDEDRPLLSSTDAMALLMPVAWTMHREQRKYDLRYDELRSLLRPVLRKLERERDDLSFGKVLRWLHQTTGVLARYATHEDGTGEYGFTHLSLQEYLAARHAAGGREPDAAALLASNFGDAWWHEVILLFVAFAEYEKNFAELVRCVVERSGLDDALQRKLINLCIDDAHAPDLRPLVAHALNSGNPVSSRSAALDLLMGHVDDEVLYAAAQVACQTESEELHAKAERIETRPARARLDSEHGEPADEQRPFDVLLCHDSSIKADALSSALGKAGLTVWRDDEQLKAEWSWQEALDETLDQVGAMAVLLDSSGSPGRRRKGGSSLGQRMWRAIGGLFGQARRAPWQWPEMRVRLSEMKRRGQPVLLVYMPGLEAEPELPLFLRDAAVVDMRGGISSGAIKRLISGIGGEQLEAIAEAQEPGLGERQVEDSVGMALLWLPGGRFTMGSLDEDEMAYKNEKPAREVEVSGLWMAETAVTNGQYEHYVRATGKEPALWSDKRYNGAEQPAVGVSWYDAVSFCNFLSERAGLEPCYAIEGENVQWKAGTTGYRLPTEAEWEYACRAGTPTRWSFGNDESQLGEYGWYDKNSDDELQPVGRKRPNPWGLYDMHGNVFEWCWDWYGPYPQSPARSEMQDPVGTAKSAMVDVYDPQRGEVVKGMVRLLRGGSFGYWARYLRSAYRNWIRPEDGGWNIGFRCVRGVAHQP
ncbi:MAG: SUMF1/EgtB/PvdO family nonheme iron enzyme [Proteobacteria bacterium]|nr:SUMF1/EgtB/PvdO family nonheme iron enzyme [Pseudomonadota bacterium]